jgi:hypothetical protein
MSARIANLKVTVPVVAWAALMGMGSFTRAGVADEITAIEKQPRVKRLAAYEAIVDRKRISDAERLLAVKAFSTHAKKLSPAFGESSPRINATLWQAILEWGHERDAAHADIAEALCQLLIDQRRNDDALPVAQAFLKAHPDNHEARAYVAWCRRAVEKQRPPAVLAFPLHFCVLTRNPDAASKADVQQCRKEVGIFNESFVTRDGKPLVKFVFKSFTPYSKARASASPLVSLGDSQQPYSSDGVAKAFNATVDGQIRDPKAINVYIFDSFSPKAGYQDPTSHGKRNANHPYLLIDWQRLGSNIQNAEPHEMGHAFGLEHVGVSGAKLTSSTNIMTSSGEGFGSGGKRDLGFTDSQAAVVLYHAARTYSRLGLGKP